MIHTVIIVHLARPWTIFHRRHMLIALARTLPAGVTMLCVDRPITLDVTWWRHPSRFLRSVWRSSCRAESPNLHLANVRTLLHDDILSRIPWMSWFNATIISTQLRRMVRGLAPQSQRVIQWIYRPEQAWVKEVYPKSDLIYECYDEYSNSPDGTPLPSIWERETQLLQTAVLTFVTTTSLLDGRRALARSIRLLPNGIPDFFLERHPPLSDPIDEIPRPRIGYVGVIRKPMNMAMLREVFAERRDWHLVLVGPVQRDSGAAALRELPNVHLVGPRPFESLPVIMQKLDVGLIPHQINAFSRAFRPLKLCEYLSAGLPVAATRLPELQGLDRFVSLSDETMPAFISAVESALGRGGEQFEHEAKEWVRDYTWDKIAERDIIPALREVFAI